LGWHRYRTCGDIETVGSSFHFGFHFFRGKSFSHQHQYVFDALDDLPQNTVVVEKLTVQVAELAENRSGAQLLMTHPGVGPVTALATEVFLGDPRRFVDGKALASYVGLIPGERSSGRRQRLGKITKQGSPLLRFLWSEAGVHAVRHDPELKRFYRRKLV
jgi:transposase